MPLATGLPASPGIASGPIVTSPEAAIGAAEAGTPAILVRAETSPDDVHGMAAAAGILTSRGGLASHAAVVARGWGIPAVVGAAGVEVRRRPGRRRAIARSTPATSSPSTAATGEVFEGAIAGHDRGRARGADAARLGARARDRDRRRARTQSPASRPIQRARRRPHGHARRLPPGPRDQGLRPGPGRRRRACCRRRTTSQPILDQLVADGLVDDGRRRLPADRRRARARAAELLAADRDAWGTDQRDRGARRVPRPRPPDEGRRHRLAAPRRRRGQVVNDHSDAAYDAAVLDRLAALHADAVAWLTPLEAGAAAARPTTALASVGRSSGARRRRALRRVTPRRQLPRHLVRAPRGPHPARRPDPRGRGRRRPRVTRPSR